jgi:hypothetical protein
MDQPRTPPAPHTLKGNDLEARGLGRHGPDRALRGDLVVGPPRTTASGGGARLGYAFGEPPGIWGRGAANAVCPHSSATC